MEASCHFNANSQLRTAAKHSRHLLTSDSGADLGLLDGLLLLLGGGPLRRLEAVERLREVIVEPLLLEAPLALLAAHAVQVLEVLRRVLGQLAGVVLDLVPRRNRG